LIPIEIALYALLAYEFVHVGPPSVIVVVTEQILTYFGVNIDEIIVEKANYF